MRFEVAWTYGGQTTVEADSREAARAAFNALDHKALLDEHHPADTDGLDVMSIEPLRDDDA